MYNEEGINELLQSINNSIEDMREHPTQIDEKNLPSTFSILVNGIDEDGIGKLFSPKMDMLMDKLFSLVESGDFSKILNQTQNIEDLLNSIFGKGSFEGPVSKTILTSIQSTTSSQKFSKLNGKMFSLVRKLKLIMKNLKKAQKNLDNPDDVKKYKEAYYAIKQVLKFTARIYMNRKLINRKVWRGLNNIVHEDVEEYEDIK